LPKSSDWKATRNEVDDESGRSIPEEIYATFYSIIIRSSFDNSIQNFSAMNAP